MQAPIFLSGHFFEREVGESESRKVRRNDWYNSAKTLVLLFSAVKKVQKIIKSKIEKQLTAENGRKGVFAEK